MTAGVDHDRIEPVGYGEDEPIADNATEEGKARNRRIAFALSLVEGVEPFVVPEPAPPEEVGPGEEPADGDGAEATGGPGGAN